MSGILLNPLTVNSKKPSIASPHNLRASGQFAIQNIGERSIHSAIVKIHVQCNTTKLSNRNVPRSRFKRDDVCLELLVLAFELRHTRLQSLIVFLQAAQLLRCRAHCRRNRTTRISTFSEDNDESAKQNVAISRLNCKQKMKENHRCQVARAYAVPCSR